MKIELAIGKQLEVEIRRIRINGEGIGYYQRLAIFVDYALPNELVKVEVVAVFPNRAIAKIIKVIKPSPKRVIPFCEVYEACGSCQLQHLDYSEALAQKSELIKQAFSRYIKQKGQANLVQTTIRDQNPLNYRNKATLPVQKIKGKNHIGMYAKGTNHFIKIKDCPIQSKLINQINNTIIDLMDKYQLDGFDPRTKKGVVRFLVVRTSKMQQAQVSFIVLARNEKLKTLVAELVERQKEIVSVYEVVNKDFKKITFFTKQMHLLYGLKTLDEQIGEFSFQLRPNAFFQLNNAQANQFYLTMKKMAQLSKDQVVVDAYAGCAPVSHYIANDVKKVYAIEIEQASCQSAIDSLKTNKIKNVSVVCDDFHKGLQKLNLAKIDCLFFDPPRSGLGEEVIRSILKHKPKQIIYGSCNPSTLAKDLELLLKHYRLIETLPIDMFPHTAVIESVSKLIRI